MRWEARATVRQLPHPAAITIFLLVDGQEVNANILSGIVSWVLVHCRVIVC